MTMSESPDDTNNVTSTSESSSLPALKCLDTVTRLRVEQLMNYIELLRGTEEANRYNVFDVSDGTTFDHKTPLLIGQEESDCFSE